MSHVTRLYVDARFQVFFSSLEEVTVLPLSDFLSTPFFPLTAAKEFAEWRMLSLSLKFDLQLAGLVFGPTFKSVPDKMIT